MTTNHFLNIAKQELQEAAARRALTATAADTPMYMFVPLAEFEKDELVEIATRLMLHIKSMTENHHQTTALYRRPRN